MPEEQRQQFCQWLEKRHNGSEVIGFKLSPSQTEITIILDSGLMFTIDALVERKDLTDLYSLGGLSALSAEDIKAARLTRQVASVAVAKAEATEAD